MQGSLGQTNNQNKLSEICNGFCNGFWNGIKSVANSVANLQPFATDFATDFFSVAKSVANLQPFATDLISSQNPLQIFSLFATDFATDFFFHCKFSAFRDRFIFVAKSVANLQPFCDGFISVTKSVAILQPFVTDFTTDLNPFHFATDFATDLLQRNIFVAIIFYYNGFRYELFPLQLSVFKSVANIFRYNNRYNLQRKFIPLQFRCKKTVAMLIFSFSVYKA